jgi:hypothetical protein
MAQEKYPNSPYLVKLTSHQTRFKKHASKPITNVRLTYIRTKKQKNI